MRAPIDRRTYRAKVYAYLRERIIAGELSPGETITLRGLAGELGVSIAPVREALVQLESEQVILRRDNRDYRVNAITRSELDEIYRIRRMVEPHLAGLACRLRPDSAVEESRRICRALRDVHGDRKRLMTLNHDLHFSIYSCADSPILLGIVRGLWARVGPYLALGVDDGNIAQDLDLHDAMLRAFEQKDPEEFTRALLADMDFSYGCVAPLLGGRSNEAGA